MWALFASFVVSFISVGWWSELGDRKGRKIVLFCSIGGAMLIDLIYLIVANMSLHDDPQDTLSLGVIVDGLLGGFISYNAVVHAYTFDVAPTPLSRLLLFGVLDTLSMVGFIVGAAIGNAASNSTAYILSVVFALLNLAFIYAVLPESLKPEDATHQTPHPRPLLKSIVSPIFIFFRAGSRKHLLLFAFAFYMYSLTSAMDTRVLMYTESMRFISWLPRWALLTLPRLLNVATFLCILPALAWHFKTKHGDTERASLRLATAVTQNSILLAVLACLGVLVFCEPPRGAHALYTLFVAVLPLTAGAGPALYALGGAYLLALGRRGEIGALFGALSLWGALAQHESFVMYDDGSISFWLSTWLFIIALLLLVPDGPSAAEDTGDAEGV